jgi:hypothetical protein
VTVRFLYAMTDGKPRYYLDEDGGASPMGYSLDGRPAFYIDDSNVYACGGQPLFYVEGNYLRDASGAVLYFDEDDGDATMPDSAMLKRPSCIR